MGSAEKLCLRWYDFESNISVAFRELREDKDFLDVTLACDDGQIQAHKVILSACSPFFRSVLRKNPHPHPLLYLKGVKYADLLAVLNFMYHGEVNVAQEELYSFLAVAEDLRVKGLSQDNSSSSEYKSSNPPPSKPRPQEYPERIDTSPSPKRPRPPPPTHHAPSSSQDNNQQSVHTINDDDDDIQEIVSVKSVPVSYTETNNTVAMAPPENPYNAAPVHGAVVDPGADNSSMYGNNNDDDDIQEVVPVKSLPVSYTETNNPVAMAPPEELYNAGSGHGAVVDSGADNSSMYGGRDYGQYGEETYGSFDGLMMDASIASADGNKGFTQGNAVAPSSLDTKDSEPHVKQQDEQSGSVAPYFRPRPDDATSSSFLNKRPRLSLKKPPQPASKPSLSPVQENNNLGAASVILVEPQDEDPTSLAPTGTNSGKIDCEDGHDGIGFGNEANDFKDDNFNEKIVITKADSDQAKLKEIFASLFQEKKNGSLTLWKCTQCGNEFSKKRFVESHIDFRHTDHLIHRCLKCGLYVSTNDALTRHIGKAHNLKLSEESGKEWPIVRVNVDIRTSTRVEARAWIQAQETIMKAQLMKSNDEQLDLQIENFDDSGRGLVTTRDRVKGEFVVEYAGDLINMSSAIEREKQYSRDEGIGSFMYFFKYDGKQFCVDATSESGRLGRLINHSKEAPNLITKVIPMEDGPRLVLFTKKDIPEGTELKFDYGDRDKETLEANPWLNT